MRLAAKRPPNRSNTAAPPTRRTELDWLRVLVVLGLIPYHAAMVFTLGRGDYIKNEQRNVVFDVGATLVSFWGMPLLFLVAGGAAWYALARYSVARYAIERVKRLTVPFVVGILLIVPVQVYYGHLATPDYHLSYPQFYTAYLADWLHVAQRFALLQGMQYWGHLWFVPYLLALSLALLPVFLHLRSASGQRVVTALARHSSHYGSLFLFGLVFGALEVILQGLIGPRPFAEYDFFNGVAGLGLFALSYFMGYVLFAASDFQQAIVRYRASAIAQGVLLGVVYEMLLALGGPQVAASGWATALTRLGHGYLTWCWLIGILGYAMRLLTVSTPLLRYLNDAFYPIYVLHLPILTVLGFYIVQWHGPSTIKYLFLVMATTVVTFAVYEVLIRHLPPMRFLFGLKPHMPKPTPRTAEVPRM